MQLENFDLLLNFALIFLWNINKTNSGKFHKHVLQIDIILWEN